MLLFMQRMALGADRSEVACPVDWVHADDGSCAWGVHHVRGRDGQPDVIGPRARRIGLVEDQIAWGDTGSRCWRARPPLRIGGGSDADTRLCPGVFGEAGAVEAQRTCSAADALCGAALPAAAPGVGDAEHRHCRAHRCRSAG
jgi:hypothetical protein